MPYFVGIDSGGTKTECWVSDETRVLARASAATVKLTRVTEEIATERMRALLIQACSAAGVDLAQVSRTCVGVAGLAMPEVREWATRVVGELIGGQVEVCGDDEIALDAAFHGGPGVLVIGGTGSGVVGRGENGAKFSAGGWGPGVGDEGSGFWIGREAVRQGFRALDRGVETGLIEAVQAAWGLRDAGALVGFANARPGPDFATLVPVVVTLADAGDEIAASILAAAGDELGEQVRLVLERMQRAGEHGLEVAFTGSILEKIPAVRTAMVSRIGGHGPVREQAVHPLDGALWRARQAPGSTRTPRR